MRVCRGVCRLAWSSSSAIEGRPWGEEASGRGAVAPTFSSERKNGNSVTRSGSVQRARMGSAYTARSWPCSHPRPQGPAVSPRAHSRPLPASHPPEYPRVGHARLHMPSVLLWEALCPGQLPHHQRLLPRERRQPRLHHLLSECCAGREARSRDYVNQTPPIPQGTYDVEEQRMSAENAPRGDGDLCLVLLGA